MFCNLAFLIVVIAASAVAASIPASHVIVEERDAAPKQWIKRARVHPESVLTVRIGLTQTNLHMGEEYLMDVSHPDSPNYGKHWTAEQVIEAFKPSDETVDSVTKWLTSSGIPTHSIAQSDNRQWLAFNAPARKMEELLHTEYHEYEDSVSGGISISRTREYGYRC